MEQNTGELSKADLVALLDKEIASLGEDDTRGGISAWALVAALGGVAFLALKDWAAAPIDFGVFCKSLTALSFVVYPASAWLWEADIWTQLNRDPARTRPASQMLHKHRTPLLVMLGLAIALVYVTYEGSLGVPRIAIALAEAAVGIGVIGSAAAFAMSFFDFGIPGVAQPTRNRATVTMWVVVIAWVATVIIGYATALTPSAWKAHVAELRLSGYAIGCGLVVRLLAGLSHRDPTIWELVRIRRDLLLARTERNVARRQIEIALLGLDSAARIERKLQAGISAHNSAIQAIEAFEKAIKDASTVANGEATGAASRDGAGNPEIAAQALRAAEVARSNAREKLVSSLRAFRRLSAHPSDDLPAGSGALDLFVELRRERAILYQRYVSDRTGLRHLSASRALV